MYKKITFLISFLASVNFLFSQTPSPQDCIGAIPVCQSTFNEVNAYSGTGNIIDYTGHRQCGNNRLCIDPEVNSVWYTFQIQESGILDFRITPNGPNTDYDWALFNLTNHNCSDLQNVNLYSQIIASCNAAYGFGTTGANTLTPNTNGNCQGPSSLNGAPINNAPLNVVAGQIYYLNIQNWSGTTAGYILDFTHSTASIFDNIPPSLIHIDNNLSCGATSITVTFSENVLCNTVDPSDFEIVGPNGTHTVTNVSGQACGQGNQENSYVLTFNPPINSGGTYNLNLIGPVTDLCGNVAPNTTLEFEVVQLVCEVVNIVQPSCGESNGSIQVRGIQGSGNYTYQWGTNPVQTTPTVSGLPAGTYTVTVFDGPCTSTCEIELFSANGPNLTLQSTASTCGLANGSASVSAQGESPFTYAWSSNPVQTTPNASNLAGGNYSVTVTDVNGCSAVSSTVVAASSPLVLAPVVTNETCKNTCNGSVLINISSGTPPYNYSWTNTNSNNEVASNLCSGNYSVAVTDAQACTANQNFTITNSSGVIAQFNWTPVDNIAPAIVTFLSSSIGANSYFWDFGNGNTSTLQNPQNTYTNAGSYNVLLITTGAAPEYCVDSIVRTIIIYEPLEVEIPNVFTPNGDGTNDYFMVSATGLETEEMIIYNRWGRKVFEWNELGGKWSGKNKSDSLDAAEGVYYYIFKGSSFDKKKIEKSGTITLIR